MRKEDALALFGGPAATARACRISKQAVSEWPDDLSPRIADRVVAAAMREGIKVSSRIAGANGRAA